MINIGVIGLGFGKDVHVPAFRNDSRCRVIAIAGSCKERAADAANELGIQYAYGNFVELLENPDIDAVTIAVPPSVQGAVIERAILSKKHVFCEKPLGCGESMGIRLLEMAKVEGLVTAVDFEFPQLPAWRHAREVIQSKELGAARNVHVDWHLQTYTNRMKISSWKRDTGARGGTLHNFVSHVFFNLEWLLEPITEICCKLAPPEQDPFHALLVFNTGLCGRISVSTNTPFTQLHRIEVFFEQGRMVLHNKSDSYFSNFSLQVTSSEGTEVVTPNSSDFINSHDSRINAVTSLAHSFLGAIEIPSTAVNFPSLREGVRNEALLDAALLSNKTRQWIHIAP